MSARVIGFTHPPIAHGGPSTFQTRLMEELRLRGWKIVFPEDNIRPDVILIVGGTTRLWWLIRCKWKGSRIVHRVAAIHWRHHVEKHSFKIFFLLEVRNLIVRLIRKYLADHIIYQSLFAENWWLSKRGATKADGSIIYNGTNTQLFKPTGEKANKKTLEIACVEGNIAANGFIVPLIRRIAQVKTGHKEVRVNIFGNASAELKAALSDMNNVVFHGHIPRAEMPLRLAENDIFLSLEINAACPNSIIEAMAAGLPVIAFATGATPELVSEDTGMLLKYDADPWQLGLPTIGQEVDMAVEKINANLEGFAEKARQRALKYHDATNMTDAYLKILDR